jgi:hypothetical protein
LRCVGRTGDAVGAVADDFAGLRFEDIHSVHTRDPFADILKNQFLCAIDCIDAADEFEHFRDGLALGL